MTSRVKEQRFALENRVKHAKYGTFTEEFMAGKTGKKTARKKAARKAKLRRGRQQQRQNPKIARLRKNKKRMRNRKMRRK